MNAVKKKRAAVARTSYDARLGAALQCQRRLKGRTLAELGDLIEVSEGEMSKKERGLSPFSQRQIEVLAAELGTTPVILDGMAALSSDAEAELLAIISSMPEAEREHLLAFLRGTTAGRRA